MPEALPDHYATLELDQRCTGTQVRAAYRRLVKQHHPDRHADSAEATARARALNAAHEILADPELRRNYDRERAAPRTPRVTAGRAQRDITHDVRLRAEDFLRGVALEVRIDDPANPLGPETYPLIVPEGTAPGERFRLPRGEPFAGGFVIVRLRALPGPRFKVRGSDLQADLRISAQRATQGGAETLPGATGRPVRVEIPPGVARGAILKVAGEGLPKSRGGRGDLLVRLQYRPEVRVTRDTGAEKRGARRRLR